MQTFVSKLLENTKHNESPTSFWKWSAYSAISAVLRNNVYRRKKNEIIFPNIYTMLVAPSSGYRKNSPISLCQALVDKVGNTKIISGRTSIQAMMDDISKSETSRNGAMPVKPGSAIFFAPELAAGIVNDPQAIQILTDIYDYKPNTYKNLLLSRANFVIDKLAFSMFSGTNIAISKDFLTSTATRGGLVARTFVISPDEFRPPFSALDDEPSKEGGKNVIDECYQDLKDISCLNGEYIADENAKDEFRKWYTPWRVSYERRQDPSGVIGRLDSGIVKISMILTANDLTLNIKKRHIEEAIGVGLDLLPNYNLFIMANGRSTISEAGGTMIQELSSCPFCKISRKILLKNHWNDFDGELLDKVVTTLEQAGMIRQIIEGNMVYYQLTEAAIAHLKGD